jgi:hypothetical protein
MAEGVGHSCLPGQSTVDRGVTSNVPVERDHGPSSAICDSLGPRLAVMPPLEHHIAESHPWGHLVEEGRELGDIVGADVGQAGGPEDREAGLARHQGLMFDGQVADAGEASGHQPTLKTGDRKSRAITGETERLPRGGSTGQLGGEASEVGRAQRGLERGDRQSRGESAKAALSTAIGTGSPRSC